MSTERKMLDLLAERYNVRYGNGRRYIIAEHVRSAAGFDARRTADAIAWDTWPSKGLEIHGFEVKCSRSDWLTELKDPAKAEVFKQHCHRWWLVAADKAIVRDDLPAGWGLLAPGADGRLRVHRQAPKLAPTPMPPGMVVAALRSTHATAHAAGHQAGRAEGVDLTHDRMRLNDANAWEGLDWLDAHELGVPITALSENPWHHHDGRPSRVFQPLRRWRARGYTVPTITEVLT